MEETTSTKVRAGRVGCNDKCGCPSPCPGGAVCRCTGVGPMAGDEAAFEHKTCGGCEQHCGCNPCSCAKSAGEAACKCGPACSCTTCAS